ncbi:MAG: helix-turn-helix transcriptional regulator [Brevundimonas sp.]|uniref:PadR family transcriptional regulator n=1 Tax=Brevundimonas sp. TaxID=1871086 RepID=UPI001A1D3EAC|nr:helix-turn-helix transcriptional regulator [Brevundimonas sp.]MBJ7446809.1 helix-turn-helix transcriptional regulator [Brevundimonas sp.]
MPDGTDIFETMRLELRRGSLVLAVLACLRTERYGYSLRQALAADGLEMEESTLYPLLRRLESQGLLDSEWREEEKRKKRFYRLSPQGVTLLASLTDEWRGINASLDKIL